MNFDVLIWEVEVHREFLHSDDLADACLFLLEHYDSAEIINIGWGTDCTIRELAEKIAETVGYSGTLKWEASRPDGTPRKLLDTHRVNNLGWQPRMSLREGLRKTYQWFREPRMIQKPLSLQVSRARMDPTSQNCAE